MSSVGVASATKRTTIQLPPFGAYAHSHHLLPSLSIIYCKNLLTAISRDQQNNSKLFLSVPEMRLTLPLESVVVTPARRDEASNAVGCSWSPGMHLAHV